MTSPSRMGSPLETVANPVAPTMADAFALLSNETRLAILLSLWEASAPYNEGSALSFAELRKRVGMQDGSQFTYHLDKLVGTFVRRTDDGYKLRGTGRAIVWAVIERAGVESPPFEASELDEPCPYCGGSTVLRYEDAHLLVTCTECEGRFSIEGFPPGIVLLQTFSPAGLTGRAPEEILEAATIQRHHRHAMLFEGVCPRCAGSVASTLFWCGEHDPATGAVCRACGRRDRFLVRFTCAVCEDGAQLPLSRAVVLHPVTKAFYYDCVIDEEFRVADFDGVPSIREAVRSHRPELVSEDPVRIRVTVSCDGDELHLTVDEAATVVDVRT
ncbi:winged helix-turn-helix domain-containing protein [Halomicrococcus sp. SG-WS-1]|uniref:winged helix-turn-helix domain-containing protein n=1 Tax=Halomicrococcus sp. SG-WS-1 TaxID=3439057 RepID=UPI003F7AD379